MRRFDSGTVRKIGNQLKSQRGILLPWLIAAAIVILARMTGALQSLELLALDYLLRIRPAEAIDERILIVGIDEEDIRRAKTYPISDRDLANLIQTLQEHQPAVIGVDIFRDFPVEPGRAELVEVFRASHASRNLIGIERVLGGEIDRVNPPQELLPEQIGFIDAVLDSDGRVRRSLLGTFDNQGNYKFSFTIRLAQYYLEKQGIQLENGIRNPDNMRFGSIELQQLTPNAGGYVEADTGGNQILINFRSGIQPFRTVPMRDVLSGNVPADWIRDRIVLVGITSASVGDIFYINAIKTQRGSVFGVEVQAHAISQIVSSVSGDRPLIYPWSNPWEYLWIAGWALSGIGLSVYLRLSLKLLLGLFLAGVAIFAICYWILMLGWWVPLVPPLLVFLLSAIAFGFRYDRSLKDQIRERQFIIERTYNEIHRGSLNMLARIQRDLYEEKISADALNYELKELEKKTRNIYEFMQQQFLKNDPFIQRKAVSQDVDLYLHQIWWGNLENPTSELLYEVYCDIVYTDVPGFRTLRRTVENFKAIDSCPLTPKEKQALCLFLEGALQNVGKHAIEVTKLEILYRFENGQHCLQVIDNGSHKDKPPETLESNDPGKNRGTRQAEGIARLLGGKFQRRPNKPHGMICELIWTDHKPRFRLF